MPKHDVHRPCEIFHKPKKPEPGFLKHSIHYGDQPDINILLAFAEEKKNMSELTS